VRFGSEYDTQLIVVYKLFGFQQTFQYKVIQACIAQKKVDIRAYVNLHTLYYLIIRNTGMCLHFSQFSVSQLV